MLRRAFFAAPVLLVCAACVSAPDPAEQVRAKAWSQVLSQTDVMRIDAATMKARASRPFLRAGDDMEVALLTRISGEAVRLGAPRFAITFVEYDESGLFGGGYAFPDEGWIGTYGDLLAARARTDYDGSLTDSFGFKEMVVVVRLLRDDEAADRPAFRAEEVYETLLAARIDERDIRPRRRLPRIRFE